VRGVFLNVAALRLDAAVPAEAAAAAQPEPDPWDDPWAEPPAAAAGGRPAAAAPAPRRQRDRADHFATQVFGLWSERVRGVAGDAPVLAALGMEARLVSDIADELVVGAQRGGVIERIAERVRAQVAAANVRWDEMADRSAGIAAMLINDFVFHLGFGDLPPDARPAVPEAPKPRQRGVFAAPALPARGAAPQLGEQRAQLARDYFLDWGVALRQLGLDNVSYAGGREIGEADNRALGDILRTLAAALRVAAP